MTTKQKLDTLKFIAVCTAAWYLYHKTKAQGSSLQGQINASRIAGLGASLLPKEYQGKVKHYGTQIINKLIQ